MKYLNFYSSKEEGDFEGELNVKQTVHRRNEAKLLFPNVEDILNTQNGIQKNSQEEPPSLMIQALKEKEREKIVLGFNKFGEKGSFAPSNHLSSPERRNIRNMMAVKLSDQIKRVTLKSEDEQQKMLSQWLCKSNNQEKRIICDWEELEIPEIKDNSNNGGESESYNSRNNEFSPQNHIKELSKSIEVHSFKNTNSFIKPSTPSELSSRPKCPIKIDMDKNRNCSKTKRDYVRKESDLDLSGKKTKASNEIKLNTLIRGRSGSRERDNSPQREQRDFKVRKGGWSARTRNNLLQHDSDKKERETFSFILESQQRIQNNEKHLNKKRIQENQNQILKDMILFQELTELNKKSPYASTSKPPFFTKLVLRKPKQCNFA